MAEAPEKGHGEMKRGQPEQEAEQRREAQREDIDLREEEGWTQPESSAQKGALPDEAESA